MQHKDIYDLMNLFFADGFTIENLCEIISVSRELIEQCINRNNLTHEEVLALGKVVTFLSLLYMVDTEECTYLKESISALEYTYNIPHNAIANYLGVSSMELDDLLDNPKDYPEKHKLLLKLMHFKAVVMQRIE